MMTFLKFFIVFSLSFSKFIISLWRFTCSGSRFIFIFIFCSVFIGFGLRRERGAR